MSWLLPENTIFIIFKLVINKYRKFSMFKFVSTKIGGHKENFRDKDSEVFYF